jgi:nicotinate-nucleotide pyrophosphorylase (carboxylating)
MNETESEDIRRSVREALAEDVGRGDLTAALIPRDALATASIVLREPAVLCGTAWADEAFRQLDPTIVTTWHCSDGAACESDAIVCSLSGPARPLLTGERTALNFLQTLSATATVTAKYCEAVAGTRAVILDTRKTLPGLRIAQKYAVRCGGGSNHRVGLYDAVLIKENHVAASKSIRDAVARATQLSPSAFIEVEIETFEQLSEALETGASRLLLDNFTPDMLIEAVRLRDAHRQHRKLLEASGGINLENVREYAETGVDMISIGSLTKNVTAIDFSMLFD